MDAVVEKNGYQDDVVVKAAPQKVAVKARPSVRVVPAEKLGAKLVSGTQVDVPQEVMEQVQAWTDDYTAFLTDRAKLYGERLSAMQANKRHGLEPQVGEPIVGTYEAFDILLVSPIQVIGLPPYEPGKIIAGGELAILEAFLWINPFVDVPNGFAVPANVQLGSRDVRVSVDFLNLTTGVAGPHFVTVFNLGSAPVPPIIPVVFAFIAPAVATPQLLEINATADILDGGQPYAAFATWHFDIDSEPAWFGGFPPNIPPELVHDIPLRCMIYPK